MPTASISRSLPYAAARGNGLRVIKEQTSLCSCKPRLVHRNVQRHGPHRSGTYWREGEHFVGPEECIKRNRFCEENQENNTTERGEIPIQQHNTITTIPAPRKSLEHETPVLRRRPTLKSTCGMTVSPITFKAETKTNIVLWAVHFDPAALPHKSPLLLSTKPRARKTPQTYLPLPTPLIQAPDKPTQIPASPAFRRSSWNSYRHFTTVWASQVPRPLPPPSSRFQFLIS